MKRTKSILFLLAFLLPLVALSQQAALIRGVVFDSSAYNRVPNATIKLIKNDTSFTLSYGNSDFKLILSKSLDDTIYVSAAGLGETKKYISLTQHQDIEYKFILPCSCSSMVDSDKCPKCHSNKDVTKIVYGYPSDELMKKYEEGKVHLGGCVVGACKFKYYCKRDTLEFGALGDYFNKK